MRLELLLILLLPIAAGAQQQKPGKNRAKDALAAARAAKDGGTEERAYLSVGEDSLQDASDVIAIYDELGKLPAEGKSEREKRRAKSANHLIEVLAKAQKPEHHAAVKTLLEKENSELSNGGLEAIKAVTTGDYDRALMRQERLHALTEAAGRGGNTQALPVLRAMRKKGGQAGKMAETAIAQLGNDADLDEFIREIKKDPKSRINLLDFGEKGYRRVIREINDSTVSAEEKIRMAARLPKKVDKAYLADSKELLRHENPRVVMLAAQTVGNSVTSEDEGFIREMLGSKNRTIRREGILAIERLWDQKYVPDLIVILKTGTDSWDKSYVAYLMGVHRVREAEGALKTLADSTGPSDVRASAKKALDELRK